MTTSNMPDVNEIRDFLHRAPPRRVFNGLTVVYHTVPRLKWLMEISTGTIHERINRRAGISDDEWVPWAVPKEWKAKHRHMKNELRKQGKRFLGDFR